MSSDDQSSSAARASDSRRLSQQQLGAADRDFGLLARIVEVQRDVAAADLDLDVVMSVIVEGAQAVAEAEGATVELVEGDEMVYRATSGAAMPHLGLRLKVATSLSGQCVESGEALLCDDSELDSRVDREACRKVGARSMVLVPLVHADSVAGVLKVFSSQPAQFSATTVWALELMAAQLAAAMLHAREFGSRQELVAQLRGTLDEVRRQDRAITRLNRQLERRAKQAGALARESSLQAETFRALNEVALATSGMLDVARLSRFLEDEAAKLLGDARGVLAWWNPDQEHLELLAHPEQGPLPEGVITTAFRSGARVVIDDYARSPASHALGRRHGIRAIVIMPLCLDGRAVGALAVYLKRKRRVPERSVQALTLLAAQVTPAIEAARLYGRLENTNAELERVSRHKTEFLAKVSHELRTPLNAILGFSRLLLDRPDGFSPEQRAVFLGHIRDGGEHLLNLINDILDLSKVEAGQAELKLGEFALRETIADVAETLSPVAAAKQITLMSECKDELWIRADRGKVKQILYNLIANAIKFTPAAGRVIIDAAPVPGGVGVAVIDTGIGIAPVDQERIFAEFQQVDQGATEPQQGTGLGLALTKSFVELHGGRVWVESEPGRGSKFRFFLPTAPEANRRRRFEGKAMS